MLNFHSYLRAQCKPIEKDYFTTLVKIDICSAPLSFGRGCVIVRVLKFNQKNVIVKKLELFISE